MQEDQSETELETTTRIEHDGKGQADVSKDDISTTTTTAVPKRRKKKQQSEEKKIAIPMSSVVKVFVVKSKPCYKLPWQHKASKNTSGSGFLIGGQRILTNAHVAEESTTIL